MNVKKMDDELKILRIKMILKITETNVHKAENLLGDMHIIIDEYSKTKDKAWLKIYDKVKKEVIKFINS